MVMYETPKIINTYSNSEVTNGLFFILYMEVFSYLKILKLMLSVQ